MNGPVCPPRIYAIADAHSLTGQDLPAAVEAMASAGILWVQIRAKYIGGGVFASWIEDSLRRLEGSRIQLWLNDRVDLAALYPVAGVHLGQEDLRPVAARSVLGPGCRIGYSTHNAKQLVQADRDPAVDVVAIGPIFSTQSKASTDPEVGLASLPGLRRLTRKPLVAIGGIDAENIAPVLAAGVDSVAVIGALTTGGTIEKNCRRLLRAAEDAG